MTCLEKVHEMGFIFNDLKPDNILIGNEPFLDSITDPIQSNPDHHSNNSSKDRQLYKVSLIDFGLVSKYKRKNGDHI